MLVRGENYNVFQSRKANKGVQFPMLWSHDLVDVLPPETGSKCVSKLKC